MTERAVRCGWLDQAARESLQVSVVPVGSGRERLGDMEPLINLHVAKHGIASPGLDLVFWRKIEREGYFGNLAKYRLCDFWLNRGAGRRMVKRFRSIDDEDGALRCVRVLTHLCVRV